MVGGRMKFL